MASKISLRLSDGIEVRLRLKCLRNGEAVMSRASSVESFFVMLLFDKSMWRNSVDPRIRAPIILSRCGVVFEIAKERRELGEAKNDASEEDP